MSRPSLHLVNYVSHGPRLAAEELLARAYPDGIEISDIPIDIGLVLEVAGVTLSYRNLDEVGIAGRLDVRRRRIYIADATCGKLEDQRYVMVHALGAYLMQPDEPQHIITTDHLKNIGLQSEEVEDEHDEFARHVLLPSEVVRSAPRLVGGNTWRTEMLAGMFYAPYALAREYRRFEQAD